MSAEDYLEVWHHDGRQELVPLRADRTTIGRAASNDVAFTTDDTVSRLHAVIESYSPGWCVRDLGSANGTFVQNEPVVGDHRLESGYEIRFGRSRVVLRAHDGPLLPATATAERPPRLTPRERVVLLELCRPLLGGGGPFPQPASVRALADRLVVSEAAIKSHLTNLYIKFGLDEPGDSRRVKLANEAVRRGAITRADLVETQA